MVLFFAKNDKVYAVDSTVAANPETIERLEWLFSDAKKV